MVDGRIVMAYSTVMSMAETSAALSLDCLVTPTHHSQHRHLTYSHRRKPENSVWLCRKRQRASMANFSFGTFSLLRVLRFVGHFPGPGQAAVHFTRESFTWAGSNPVPF
ncbi:unnamed protein product [Brassica oleracea]